MKAPIPQYLRERCIGPTTSLRTQADDDAFKIQQEAALKLCEGKLKAAVSILDAINEASRERGKRWGVF